MIMLRKFLLPFWICIQFIQSIFVRIAYHLYKNRTKPIWLHSDRINTGGDNGEIFFTYCVKHYKDVEHIFIIDPKSPDAKRIGKFGKIVGVKSFRHKVFFLLAEKYFLSHPEIYFMNPFGSAKKFYSKFTQPKIIFLQHGITKGDLSSWLSKGEMNFWKIVTAAKKEYDSFLEFPYGYSEENLISCGFPRFDTLKDDPKSKIIIMPTWRKSLVGEFNRRTGSYSYNPDFKKSEYLKFYNNLINDPKLLSVMQKYNLAGEFFIHPALTAQKSDFASNDIFKVFHSPFDYNKAFAEGNLLITDYSSVAFDFGYLNKPVIYCQFDADEINDGSIAFAKEYISAKKDGFGPVINTYELTIKEILKYIETDFKIPAKYRDRANKLYFHRDRNNCKRLLEVITRKSNS